VFYVLRLLLDEEIPLNEGLLHCVPIDIPSNSLLNPKEQPDFRPAVAAGNVETSQQLVDLLLSAFGVMANSQGTMNNFLFGSETTANDSSSQGSYYETIGGGMGATAAGPGASAVQSHMTNTRLTDPEVLEARFPIRLVCHSRRSNSGGAGQFRGGDGVIREYQFLAPQTVSLITSRRTTAPQGLAGGKPGASGANLLIAADGRHETLPAVITLTVKPGDRIRLATPGGGGYGRG